MYATIGILNILTFVVSSPVQKLRHNQGRIQDLQLGVAQKNWKLKKKGGGGHFKQKYIYLNYEIFRNTIFITILYILSPLTQYCIEKKTIWKFLGVARCCQQTDMSGVKLQMDMGLIRINGPWGVENTPLVTEIWHLKCKQVL